MYQNLSPTLNQHLYSFFNLYSHTEWNFPDQGANPCPLNWKHGVLATAPPSLTLIFQFNFYFEITGDSYAVVRKNTAIPLPSCPKFHSITNKIWKMTQSRYSSVPLARILLLHYYGQTHSSPLSHCSPCPRQPLIYSLFYNYATSRMLHE